MWGFPGPLVHERSAQSEPDLLMGPVNRAERRRQRLCNDYALVGIDSHYDFKWLAPAQPVIRADASSGHGPV